MSGAGLRGPGDGGVGVDRILVTDQGLSTAHLVREDQLVEGGKLQGVCGRVFLPAALTAPLGTTCALCLAVAGPQGRPARWPG